MSLAQVSDPPAASGFLFSYADSPPFRISFALLSPRCFFSVSWPTQFASRYFSETSCSSRIALSVSFCLEPQYLYCFDFVDIANVHADFATWVKSLVSSWPHMRVVFPGCTQCCHVWSCDLLLSVPLALICRHSTETTPRDKHQAGTSTPAFFIALCYSTTYLNAYFGGLKSRCFVFVPLALLAEDWSRTEQVSACLFFHPLLLS